MQRHTVTLPRSEYPMTVLTPETALEEHLLHAVIMYAFRGWESFRDRQDRTWRLEGVTWYTDTDHPQWIASLRLDDNKPFDLFDFGTSVQLIIHVEDAGDRHRVWWIAGEQASDTNYYPLMKLLVAP